MPSFLDGRHTAIGVPLGMRQHWLDKLLDSVES
jgi:hypothetical protein